jgi:hypothetical protein
MRTVEGGRSGLKMKNYYENEAHKYLYEARVRPTIGWSIKCENSDQRTKAYDAIRSVRSPALMVGSSVRGCIIAALVLACIAICMSCCIFGFIAELESVNDHGVVYFAMFCQFIWMVTITAVLIAPMQFFWASSEKLSQSYKALHEFRNKHEEWINSCTNKYAWIDTSSMLEKNSFDLDHQPILAMTSWLCILLTMVLIGTITLIFCIFAILEFCDCH